MKNTIIHLTTFLQGGAGKLICELIAHQQVCDYQILCVCNNEGYPGYQNYPEYEQVLNELNVPLLKLPGLFKRGVQEQEGAVQALLNALQNPNAIKLIHAHAAIPAEVAMQFRSRLDLCFPVIATMHGWGTNKTVQQAQQDIEILSRVDAVIAVSESARKQLLDKGLRSSSLHCIHNGVALQNTQLPKEWRLECLNDHDDKTFKMVCLGSVCERKNQLLLLKAVSVLKSAGLNLVCVLIGELDEAYAQQIHSVINEHDLRDCLVLCGELADADRYLGGFDVMVLPTRAEGMPISILEAFRENTLVLSSDIDECRELIDDGLNGFLFESDNAQALAEKLIMISKLESRQLNAITQRAYQRLQEHYSQQVMFDAYDAFYQELAEQPDGMPLKTLSWTE